MPARGFQLPDRYIQEAVATADLRARDGDQNAAIAVQMLTEFEMALQEETKLRAALEDPHWRLRHICWNQSWRRYCGLVAMNCWHLRDQNLPSSGSRFDEKLL